MHETPPTVSNPSLFCIHHPTQYIEMMGLLKMMNLLACNLSLIGLLLCSIQASGFFSCTSGVKKSTSNHANLLINDLQTSVNHMHPVFDTVIESVSLYYWTYIVRFSLQKYLKTNLVKCSNTLYKYIGAYLLLVHRWQPLKGRY